MCIRDSIKLKQYKETVAPDSPIITLLNPSGAPGGYYVEQGFVPASGATIAVPDGTSVWAIEGENQTLTAATPVTLRWDNGAGQVFRRIYELDDKFLFTVTQSLENSAATPFSAAPYGILARHGQPDTQNFLSLIHI